MKQTIVSEDNKLAIDILRLRYWHHVVNDALKNKAFTIPVHLGFGHEAIAGAVNGMMRDDDQLVLTHRNITYNLARAGSLKTVYDEYKLEPTAIGGGKLGSMNLANPDRGIVYTSSILGNNMAVACGLALAKQVNASAGMVIVLTGDGAMEEGQFYESLVFAKSQKLKLLFIVENNDMAMSSSIEQRRCPIALEQMSAAVDIPFRHLQGNDIFEYLGALESIRKLIVDGSMPVCVEAQLASINQHAGPTPGWPTDPKKISMDNGLIVEETSFDPVYVLQQRIGQAAFARLAEQVLSEGWA